MNIRKSLLLVCAALTACSVGAPYKQPSMPTPAAFTNSTGAAQNWPDKNWWEQFHSPQLTALMTAALQNNYDIKAAVARIHQADAQLKIAGATLLPSVDLDASSQRSQTSSKTNSSGTLGTTNNRTFTSNANSASLAASYELDFWGKNRAAVASANALASASRYDKEVVQLTTTSSVANTYFDMLATQARLNAAQGNLAASQHLLKSYQNRFAQGTASALDVAQEENLVATEGAAIPPLALELQQDKNALAILVGKLPEGFDVDLTQTPLDTIAAPEIASGLPSGLLARRPDVQVAEADLISAHENITEARAAFFPDITLTAEGGYSSAVLSNLFKPGGEFFTLGAGLTQPIFHGGALSGELDLTKAQYDELLQDYRKAVISAFADTENALTAAKQDNILVTDQQQAADTAQRAYDLTQKQFQQGVVDITSVLNTQRSLFAAQDTLAQAQLAHLESDVNLYVALGGGWAKP
jgi:NodT family efflux transporter outer membrane factor (OMF) lipoprotein